MKRYIHVNQFVIRHNKKYNNTLPACRVQEGKTKSRYCTEVVINGPSKLVSSPDKPLACGARVWIETESDVKLVKEVQYSTIKSKMEKDKIKASKVKVCKRK